MAAGRVCRSSPRPFSGLIIAVLTQQGVVLLHAFGAYAVGEFRFGVSSDIYFHLLPVTRVVADLLAVRTDGQDAPQCLYLIECFLQFADELLVPLLGQLAFFDFLFELFPLPVELAEPS